MAINFVLHVVSIGSATHHVDVDMRSIIGAGGSREGGRNWTSFSIVGNRRILHV